MVECSEKILKTWKIPTNQEFVLYFVYLLLFVM